MRKAVSLFCLCMVMTAMLCGCKFIRIEEEAPKPLKYTIVEQELIPKEAMALIEEKRETEFQITYQSGEDLYLMKGYGRQMSGGYSIQVEELSSSNTGIFFRTKLLGPPADNVGTEPSYPYIVVKTQFLDRPVQFE